MNLCCRVLPNYRVSSIPELYLLMSVAPLPFPPPVVTIKNVSAHHQMAPGGPKVTENTEYVHINLKLQDSRKKQE